MASKTNYVGDKGTFVSDVDVGGKFQGDIVNNLNAFDFGERVLGLMTDPRFLNVKCEDLSAGNLIDISGKGHDGTPGGTWTSGDRLKRGRLWTLDPNGTDAYVNLGDHNDFSFGDGTNDSPFTVFGLVEADTTAVLQRIMTKYDSAGGGKREWLFSINADRTVQLIVLDNSGVFECYKKTDAGISVGIHSIVISYSGVGGGSAGDGITIYIDEVVVASTATNNASYVAMENGTCVLLIGAINAASPSQYLSGDFGCIGLDAVEFAAIDAQRFHQLCLAYYSEDGATL